MGEALYRKYRPKSLDEVVGQPHITQTLENALKQGRISHGYLFSGPRGVGKTSIARILAHQINQFDYGDPRGALDIIEIDAASNRRIDEIRELRDKVHIAPVTGKYKVYIIDEVHMLTREAFNALLKTLEEPPAHVVFILATTEAHKLPETIVSRTQRYTFKPVSQKEVVAHLQSLAKTEGITISDEALGLIATHGEGSFRDSISLLDQLGTHKKVSEDDVRELLGLPPETVITNLLAATQAGNTAKIADLLIDADNNGYSSTEIASELSKHIRSALIEGHAVYDKQTVSILEKLLQVSGSINPKDYLELILLDIALNNQPPETQVVAPIASTSPPKNSATKEVPTTKNETAASPVAQQKKEPIKAKASQKQISESQLEELVSNGLWEEVLGILKQKYNTLYGVARMASPTVEENTLILSVPFAFHNKRLSEEKNSIVINNILFEQAGGYVAFSTRVDESKKPRSKTESSTPSQNSDTIAAVTEIFGGGEVLES